VAALSAADVGAHAPSWNHEAGFGTFLLHATPMLGLSAVLLAIQMGQDGRLVGPGDVPLPDARERRLLKAGFCRWVEGTGPRRPCPGTMGRTDPGFAASS